jgi:hypothetical protein
MEVIAVDSLITGKDDSQAHPSLWESKLLKAAGN